MHPPIQECVLNYDAAARLVGDHADSILSVVSGVPQELELLKARGRVLATAVVADRDQPPFNRSTRDGFACRAADAMSGHPLNVVGLVRAGHLWTGQALKPSEAVEIMTGAPVPSGLDCVVMVEKVSASTDATGPSILLAPGTSIRSGNNIVPTGAEARAGDTIIPAHTRLTASHIGAAAFCGYLTVEVYVRPKVAILATGDELVDASAVPQSHQIRNSNSYSLAAQIAAAGAEPIIMPIVKDDALATETAIREAAKYDLVLLSGGVSMGKYDFVEQALASIGAEFFFTGVRIQPGKPVVFGRLAKSDRYFFGLPGNPISTVVTFALFVQPILSALGGVRESPQFVQAELAESVKTSTGLTRFLPAALETSLGGVSVKPVRWQGSGDLASAARANCFLVIPPDREQVDAGETVHVLLS